MYNFDIKLTEVSSYGNQYPNGSWFGGMGMVTRGEVDFALNDFSITKSRSEAVDFSSGIYQQYLQVYTTSH